MSRLTFSPLALDDLDAIYEYISQDNRSAARRFLGKLHDRFRMLARQPLLGERHPGVGQDLRLFSFTSYVILYKPLANGVEVLRVIHGARHLDDTI